MKCQSLGRNLKCFWNHFDCPGSPPPQVNAQGGCSVSWAKRGGVFQAPESPEDTIPAPNQDRYNSKSVINWPAYHWLIYLTYCATFAILIDLDQICRVQKNISMIEFSRSRYLCEKHHNSSYPDMRSWCSVLILRPRWQLSKMIAKWMDVQDPSADLEKANQSDVEHADGWADWSRGVCLIPWGVAIEVSQNMCQVPSKVKCTTTHHAWYNEKIHVEIESLCWQLWASGCFWHFWRELTAG